MSSSEAAVESPAPPDRPLVMQLIVEKTLMKEKAWGRGPMMAQAAHAAIAILAETHDDPRTLEYTSPGNLTRMHKIVLQTHKTQTLESLSRQLRDAHSADGDFPRHHLWIEQPEGIATCLAVAPNRKPEALQTLLSKCSLLCD